MNTQTKTVSSVGFLANFILFLALAVVIGLGSAWYALENGLPITTKSIGPWKIWFEAGRIDPDPYTRAYVARTGRLPITSTHALYYIAKTDQDGYRLTTNCEYELLGAPLEAEWWSIAIYDSYGNVFPNLANRYSYNSANTTRHENGKFNIVISQNARPGNWLPVSGDTQLMIMMRVLGAARKEESQAMVAMEQKLPVIKRGACL